MIYVFHLYFASQIPNAMYFYFYLYCNYLKCGIDANLCCQQDIEQRSTIIFVLNMVLGSEFACILLFTDVYNFIEFYLVELQYDVVLLCHQHHFDFEIDQNGIKTIVVALRDPKLASFK